MTATAADLGHPDPGAGVRGASVVVCAYTERRWDILREAIVAALAQRPAPSEVLVVVDHNDTLRERCEAELPPGVRVLANEGGRGLSGARNTGVRHAAHGVVVFLDDDAVPEEGWLRELLEPYDDPLVVGVGGKALPRWSTEPPGWLPAEFLWTVGCSYRGLPTSPAPVRTPIGANMSFRRSVFDAGGFTEGIGRLGTTPLGCEETELSIRIRQSASRAVILYAPSALVRHLVPPERLTLAYFVSRCWAEGLSKALVSAQVGAEDALASERAYTLRTLPSGVLRGIQGAVRGDRWALARAAAIVAGLVVTSAGYAWGVLRSHARRGRPPLT